MKRSRRILHRLQRGWITCNGNIIRNSPSLWGHSLSYQPVASLMNLANFTNNIHVFIPSSQRHYISCLFLPSTLYTCSLPTYKAPDTRSINHSFTSHTRHDFLLRLVIALRYHDRKQVQGQITQIIYPNAFHPSTCKAHSMLSGSHFSLLSSCSHDKVLKFIHTTINLLRLNRYEYHKCMSIVNKRFQVSTLKFSGPAFRQITKILDASSCSLSCTSISAQKQGHFKSFCSTSK